MSAPLVSIVMPVHNGEAFLAEAVHSVLAQDTPEWELLVVDNGSTDGTLELLHRYTDPRIRILQEPEAGVAHARNAALSVMRGTFFCFLDADDRMPPNALSARLELLLRHPETHFADGAIRVMEHGTGRVLEDRRTSFRGAPFAALMRMDDTAFLGNTWMIRRMPGARYAFPTHMTNSEDLAFYLGIAEQGLYDRTPTVVLEYRKGHGSATSRMDRMHEGYRELHRFMRTSTPADGPQLAYAWKRMRQWMCKDHLRALHPWRALQAWLEPEPKSRS